MHDWLAYRLTVRFGMSWIFFLQLSFEIQYSGSRRCSESERGRVAPARTLDDKLYHIRTRIEWIVRRRHRESYACQTSAPLLDTTRQEPAYINRIYVLNCTVLSIRLHAIIRGYSCNVRVQTQYVCTFGTHTEQISCLVTYKVLTCIVQSKTL